jgi:hypothetical protein
MLLTDIPLNSVFKISREERGEREKERERVREREKKTY